MVDVSRPLLLIMRKTVHTYHLKSSASIRSKTTTAGFYYGWFSKNTAGRDVCKGAEFEVEMLGDIVTLKGTIKAVPPEQAAVELAGDIQVTPAAAYFQGAYVCVGEGEIGGWVIFA